MMVQAWIARPGPDESAGSDGQAKRDRPCSGQNFHDRGGTPADCLEWGLCLDSVSALTVVPAPQRSRHRHRNRRRRRNRSSKPVAASSAGSAGFRVSGRGRRDPQGRRSASRWWGRGRCRRPRPGSLRSRSPRCRCCRCGSAASRSRVRGRYRPSRRMTCSAARGRRRHARPKIAGRYPVRNARVIAICSISSNRSRSSRLGRGLSDCGRKSSTASELFTQKF